MLLGGCAAVTQSMLPPDAARSIDSTQPTKTAATGNALVFITVPSNTPGVRRRFMRHGHPEYVSTATVGMTIAFLHGAKTVAEETLSLKPGSKGCKTTSAGTRCGFAVKLKACSGSALNCYLANVSTYDAVSCSAKPTACTIPPGANLLSTEQQYPVGIFAHKSTLLTLTLAGVPTSTIVKPADGVTVANAQGGYDLIGLGPHAFAVEFLDAAGEAIVGSGAPTLTLTSPTGNLTPVTVATPSASPNEVYVTPPSTFGGSRTATFTVAASFAGQATNGCAARGANCAAVPVTVDMVKMLAISNGNLQLYALGSSEPVLTLDDGETGLASDPAGNLYTGGLVQGLGCCHGLGSAEGLVVYSPPFVEGATPTSQGGILAFLSQVPNQGAYALYLSDDVFYPFDSTVLCSNATCTAGSTYGLSDSYTYTVAADAIGDTAAAYNTGGACKILVGTNTNPTISIGSSPPCAQSIAFDPSGNLFFTVPNGYKIIEASKSSGYATLTTVATGTSLPYQLAIDQSGNVLSAGQDALSLAATLQYVSTATLGANQGETVNPDRTTTIASPPSGEGTAQEVLTIDAGQAYVEYSFLAGSTGNLATYALPGLTQVGVTQQNDAASPNGIAIVP